MPGIDSISKSSLQKNGVGDYSANIGSDRAIYPAIVVPYGTNDNSEQNRIRARIVEVDENGKIKGKTDSTPKAADGIENYNNYSGKDRGINDENLVLCIPLLPEFFHVRPQVGEMVFVILENPKDTAGARYWIGPIISSKLKLESQLYEDAVKIFNKTDFISNTKTSSSIELTNLLPSESDVALQGRNDADLMLKNRELLLVSGKFNNRKSGNLTINTDSPSFLRLKQFDNLNIQTPIPPPSVIIYGISADVMIDTNGLFIGTIVVTHLTSNGELKRETNSYSNRKFIIDWLKEKIKEAKEKYKGWKFSSNADEFKTEPANANIKPTPTPTTSPPTSNQQLLQKFSQATLLSTNINIYSPRGKFRGNDLKNFEKNADLKSFGEFADTLHPAIFGDEVVRLFDIIIKLLLTHIHTPQMPLLTTALADELKKYTVDGYLQNLLSYHVRIN